MKSFTVKHVFYSFLIYLTQAQPDTMCVGLGRTFGESYVNGVKASDRQMVIHQGIYQSKLLWQSDVTVA
jgi:hypothetical protein